jgi:hypothetical protein
MEEIRVTIAPSLLNNWCRIVRTRLSEFQCLVRIGKKDQALESLADIEDALSALAILAKEVNND